MSDYHNHQKKIALINDMTGFGRCSIAVALPVISMLRVQCCALPTAIFSNHTGFESFYYQDYTDHMQPSIDEWKKLDLSFSGICTGFLGSARQIAIVSNFIRDFKRPDNLVIIDPVMGDYGRPYPTYTREMCDHMKDLVHYAEYSDSKYDRGLHSAQTPRTKTRSGISQKSRLWPRSFPRPVLQRLLSPASRRVSMLPTSAMKPANLPVF